MLPFSSISERLEDIARYTLIYTVLSIFFIADVIAIPNPFDWIMGIPFVIIAIYYWSIHRPTIMPAFLAFAAGLMIDILSGAPFGLNAMLFVLLQWAISDQRAFLSAQNFAMIWLVFAIVFSVILMVQWFVTGLLNFNWVSIMQAAPQMMTALLTFPIITLLLHMTKKILPNMKMSLSSRELQ